MGELNVDLGALQEEVDADERKTLDRIASGVADKPTLSPEANAAQARATKPKLTTVVHDGFSMPEDDYAIIEKTTQRIIELGLLQARHAANKSQVLRAALHALDGLDAGELAYVLKKAPPLQAGRASPQPPRRGA